MKRSCTILSFFLLLYNYSNYAQTLRYVQMADNAIFQSKYDKAKSYYLKALKKSPDSYKINLEMGLLLTDYMDSYEHSLPYLQKALLLNPRKDTAPALMFALGRNYQYFGKFDSANYYFQKLERYEDLDDDMFELKLNKDLDDCKYAKQYNMPVSSKQLYVVNAGKTINTSMQEYVPVLLGKDKLLYTSKRKDDDKEEINADNGKYFESMYISNINNGRTSKSKMFTIPSSFIVSKLSTNDESVISAVPDSKRIFLYRDGKIYEGDITASIERPKKLDKVINFDEYQNHACVTKDGRTLYFTSEAGEGMGGNDIYMCTKNTDGSWGNRQNLGNVINTVFDEESPFIAEDGKTLYFSSRGHPGYGGFDVYKSVFENGTWSTPENLGKPVNSTANDLFFVMNADNTMGYFSSSRDGGLGDLDIYKINFTNKMQPDCNNAEAKSITIKVNPADGDRNKYNFAATLPDNMKDKIIHFSWMVNDTVVAKDEPTYTYTFRNLGKYEVKAEMMAWCDTCINPYYACAEKNITIDMLENYNVELLAAMAAKLPTSAVSTSILYPNINFTYYKKLSENVSKEEAQNYYSTELASVHGDLSIEQAAKLGLNIQPVYFEFNKSTVTADGIAQLERDKEYLTNYPDITLTVMGYTDARGRAAYNKHLSLKRANAVKKYFAVLPKNKNKYNAVGKGETEPVNQCTDNVTCDESLHQQNRRAEFKVVKK